MGILNEIPDLPLTLLFPANTAASLLALVLKPAPQEWKNTARSSGHLISEGAGQDCLAWKIPRAGNLGPQQPPWCGISISSPSAAEAGAHPKRAPQDIHLEKSTLYPNWSWESESQVLEKIALIALTERHCQVTSKNKICWMDAV